MYGDRNRLTTQLSLEAMRMDTECLQFSRKFEIWSKISIEMNLSYDEPVHEISNNVACATIKASDQPAHTRAV